jgi:carbamoyl-phosphate synthase large subunit
MSEARPTVLLTGAGGAAIPGLIDCLRDAGFFVVAVDMNPQAPGLVLADAAAVVPAGNDPKFIAVLRAICRRHDVRAVVPLVDEELAACTELRTDGIAVIVPHRAFIETCLDKERLMQALVAAGLPAPRTASAAAGAGAVGFPCVLKPRYGRGSRGLAIVHDKASFAEAVTANPYPLHALIQQEYIEGPEFTVSVTVSGDGTILGVVPKEIIVKKGITWVAVSRRNAAIDKLCREIQGKFRADGPFNVQLRIDPAGRPMTFEINPRFSTTVTLTAAAGIDEMRALIAIAIAQETAVVDQTWREGVVLVRSMHDSFIDEEDYRKRASAIAPVPA